MARAAFGVSAGTLLQSSIDRSLTIPLGCSALDDLLGGAIQTQTILEIVGPTSSGKTQLCLNCLYHTVVSTDEVTAIFIDTGSSFEPSRLAEIMQQREQGTQKEATDELAEEKSLEEFLAHVLSKIECYKAFDAFTLLSILQSMYKNLKEQTIPFYKSLRLIIIDSLAAVVSPMLGGKQIIGHVVMMEISRYMKILADEFHLVVVYTNYTISNYSQQNARPKPALGESWRSIPHTRLLLSSTPLHRKRTAELTKSTWMVRNEIKESKYPICTTNFVPSPAEK